MSCDVGKASEGLENELWRRWSDVRVGEWGFTYVRAHSPTHPPLYLHHSSLYNPSVASPTSQVILQPFRRFIYATAHSTTLPPLHLRHKSFYNPSVASPTSQVILQTLPLLHLRHRHTYVEPPMSLWWCLIYPWWFCNLQWLRPAGLYERCKLALELKRLKTPALASLL